MNQSDYMENKAFIALHQIWKFNDIGLFRLVNVVVDCGRRKLVDDKGVERVEKKGSWKNLKGMMDVQV